MDRRNDPCEMVGVHESVLHHGVGGCIITPKATIPSYPLKRSTFVAGWKLALPLEVSAYQVCQAHRPCSSREIVFGSTHSFPGWCGRDIEEEMESPAADVRSWESSRLNGSCPGGYRGTKTFGARLTWNLHP